MSKKNVDNGEWFSVAERLPKRVRVRILEVLLEDYYQKSIAEFCEVDSSLVSHWVNREGHWPIARSSVRLLKLGLRLNPEKTERIILEDIGKHLNNLEKIGIYVRDDLEDGTGAQLSNTPNRKNRV